ncbi:MAG: OmpA family protein [Muribaculaceae bacterium]|nr:OmpA family protein [Muribaculaceae bacterium]
MKKTLLLSGTAIAFAAMAAPTATAQEESITVVEETSIVSEIPCKTHYYSSSKDNWFIQIGAGIASPFMEDHPQGSGPEHHISVNYNFGFGKWMSPYLAWRLSFYGGPLHWENVSWEKSKYVNANFDLMWDMFNSLGGVNSRRAFSIVPFVGLGGSYAWDFEPNHGNISNHHNKQKTNSWTLPVSAGLQLRFRLCKYVDFFAEGRVSFYGDNFNNYAYGSPVDMNITATGGFSFNIGGCDFKSYNPCDYLDYINTLNGQVNDLRAALATTGAALAAAEAQLPCPEPVEAVAVESVPAPLMATVRFTINSAKITDEEMVNVYNVSKWMKENPDQNVAIIGYADKDTGTSAYNMGLSKRRAEAVCNALVNKYGINPDRLSIQGEGSNVQPYDVNNWNRIVIFNAK